MAEDEIRFPVLLSICQNLQLKKSFFEKVGFLIAKRFPSNPHLCTLKRIKDIFTHETLTNISYVLICKYRKQLGVKVHGLELEPQGPPEIAQFQEGILRLRNILNDWLI